MVGKLKEGCLGKLKENSGAVLQEFDDIGKELVQNIADMSNIKSDINQNIEKIIKKIDLQDFLCILDKYTQKLGKFTEISKFLESEQTTILSFAPLSETSLDTISTMMKTAQLPTSYLELKI